MPSGTKPCLAIFASGGGSNADRICAYFKDHPQISVGVIITNNANAGVRQVAERHDIPSFVITKKDWHTSEHVLPLLEQHDISHIILAGFLLLIPEWLIKAYPDRIVNIHPALLPKYGGKGMYGHHVHEAVKAAGETYSGITIHIVDEQYDKGDILFQAKVDLDEDDTPGEIAAKVLKLEHYYFPRVIERWVLNQSILDLEKR